MPAPEFPKRTAISLVIAAIAIAALATLPIFEHWLQTIFLPQFGWSFENNWQLTQDSSRGSMMSSTYVSLIENFFRLLKVFLAMALVVTVVRFLADLIFVGRTVGQREISSLLRTVLSVTIYVIAFAIIFP